ncbi:separin (caspase fold protease) [Cryptosporidium sp. chipmunk genotype I]|uniref:separin (caspase fold protease) n=1 Tax=Cryptosporidium sp. chipmunk genotype I TaxID=1280935 RepID=UPI00351AB0E3|nr:separin (caspase fold protease) [Cryptosporidium sp. chipmunk genotype I]
MDNNLFEALFELSRSNRFEDLLIQCLELLLQRISNIFSFENKHINNESKHKNNANSSDIFDSLMGIFQCSARMEIIISIKEELMKMTNFSQIEKLFQTNINQVLSNFNDIYKIYGFVSVCCIELKNKKILIYYLILSHNILPCFIIGDLLFFKKGILRVWNTEKVLISSIAKVSKEIYQNHNSKSSSTEMEELYFSWIICFDNWLEYLKTRLFIINNSQRNLSEDVLGLAKYIKELFHLISKSNLSYYYQILIIVHFCDSLSINTLNNIEIFDLFENQSLNNNLLSRAIEDSGLYKGIDKLFNTFIKFRMFNTILDLIVILNGLSTLLINIVHQGMKKLNDPETDLSIRINDYLFINSIEYYSFEIKFERLKLVMMELHYLKANLCIPNQLLLERLCFRQYSPNKLSLTITFDQRFQKVLTSYLFLTIGVINSYSKIDLDKNLIFIVGNLLNSQCLILKNILKEKYSFDQVFFKNMDSYRTLLLDYTVRQIFFLRSKSKNFEVLCENCIHKVVKILSLVLEIQSNQPQECRTEENFCIANKMNIKFKTSICEVVMKSIQFTNVILDEFFIIMEEIIKNILNTAQVEDSYMDEVILNFLLSTSENLIRLSSQMKSIKKFQDSVKLLSLALKCLSNTFNVPWIVTNEPISDIEKKIEKLKIIEESQDDLSEHLYSTPVRKNDYLQGKNNLIDNSFDLTKNPNTCARFWKNNNFEINSNESFKHKNVNFVPKSTNAKFENVTPFTQKLKSKGISQLKSQTIKRIQTSAISYIARSKSKFNKINDREVVTLTQKLQDSEVDFPIHILLFLIAIDQIISSIQLQFSQEPTQSYLNSILLLVEENIRTLFTLIDDRSYLFILGNKIFELFPFIEDFDKINLKNIKVESNTNDCEKLIRQYFFNLLSSIIARFAKTKMLLINEFSVDKMALYRYPEIENDRNYIIKMLWFSLELNYYLYFREVSKKYMQIFKKGISNGFCEELMNVYKQVNKFVDEKTKQILISSSKLNFELYFKFKVEFLNYYLWLLKIIFNIQSENIIQVNSKIIYKNEVNKLLDELNSMINSLTVNYKLLYLSRINIYKIYLLFFEDLSSSLPIIITTNLSKDKNNRIHLILQESVDLLYKYLRIYKYCDDQNFHILLSLKYWECEQQKINNDTVLYGQNSNFLKNIEEGDITLSEFDDIPIPINKNLSKSKQNEQNNLSKSEDNNYSESTTNIKTFVRFETNRYIDTDQEIYWNFIHEMGLAELEILFNVVYEVQELVLLQDLDPMLFRKLIGAALYLFSPCWTFILSLETEILVEKEYISKKIHFSLNEFISNLELTLKSNEQKEILIINIGLFISNILYNSAQIIDEIYHSNESIPRWINIAKIYSDGLIFLIESKYLLSSDFLDEKLPTPLSVTETLLNLIVLKVEHIDKINEVFQYLEIINKVRVYEIVKDGQNITGLLIRIINKLSTLFMDANQPDISLFYLLESNKILQVITSFLETCNINSLNWQGTILSACISHNSQIYYVDLVIKSLFQLGEFWWKLGVIERSQSVYNKLITFYKKWTIPYKKFIIFYFYQLPTLLNHIFSRSDSQYNLVYSIDNLDLFKQILYEENNCENSECSSQTIFLKEILEYIKIISDCESLSLFEEEVLLMMLLFVLIYFTLNNSLSIIKDYYTNNFSFIFQIFEEYSTEIHQYKSIQTLGRIIIKLLKHDLSSSNLILELLSINLTEHSKNKHFTFFFCNAINYILIFISSKYTQIIGNYFSKKCQKKTDENIVILETEFDITKKFNSNIKKNSIEFTIKEICNLIISIKQILSIELTPLESQVKSIEPTKFICSNNENKLMSSDFFVGKYELTLLTDQLDENESCIKNRLYLFKQILIFVNAILNHILLNERMNYYSLNQLSVSIILDTVLLMKVLCYPDTSWNTIFCCFINSLTPFALVSDYSFSIIQSIRKIQREFEYFKTRDKNFNSVSDRSSYSILLKFFLENKSNQLTSWRWGEETSIKEIGNNISTVYVRFSTFFTNFTYKNSNRSRYSLLQITKDFSFNKYSYKGAIVNNQLIQGSSKLTLLHFVENIQINKLLEEFDNIQRMNTESIVNVDFNTNSSQQARQWWNKRISIESRLNNWLNKFSNQILKGWITKLFYGWRKELNTGKNIKQVVEFINTHLTNINQSLIDTILFSLTNNALQILAVLESSNILNFDLNDLFIKFKKIKFQPSKNKVENFPVIIFLDKILISLPIESICDLRLQPITRGINRRMCKYNIDHLFSKLQKPKESNFYLLSNSCNLYYCINPTGDLEETEKTIISFIKQKLGSKCSGISSSIPQATVIMNNMCFNQSNLYLFCGHQAGEKFIQGEAFERGIVNENFDCDRYHFHIPPSLLIGCSSSKIRSYGSNHVFFTPMHYLIGGSPFVLGALWDVTDQDIDRFTMSIFDNWVGSKLSLIESITLAKQECKLPLLNGSSCVCFGYPI